MVSCLAILVLAVRVAWMVSAGNSVTTTLPVGMLKWIAVDGLSALILLLIALVGSTAALFSVGYMAQGNRELRKLQLYYANYNLFIFSMLAIPVLAEPTLVWIVVELTTLCSALLVSFENTREALEAAWKYVVLSLMGAAMALFGFLVLFAAMQAAGGGVYTWAGLVAAAPARTNPSISRRQCGAYFWWTRYNGRAATGSFFKRIFDSEGRSQAETLLGDRPSCFLHRHRIFRCDAAHQPNGFRRAGKGRCGGRERTFQRRERTSITLQLPPDAASGGFASAAARLLHSKAAAGSANAGRGCFDKMNRS